MLKLPLPLLCLLGMLFLFPVAHAQEPPVTVAEAEAVTPNIPPAPVRPSDTLGWMLTLAIISNGLMRKLQDSKLFPMIYQGAGKINIAIAAVLAAATSVGIHTSFDAGAGTFLITGLHLDSIIHFAGEWLRQYALQHFTYQASRVTV